MKASVAFPLIIISLAAAAPLNPDFSARGLLNGLLNSIPLVGPVLGDVLGDLPIVGGLLKRQSSDSGHGEPLNINLPARGLLDPVLEHLPVVGALTPILDNLPIVGAILKERSPDSVVEGCDLSQAEEWLAQLQKLAPTTDPADAAILASLMNNLIRCGYGALLRNLLSGGSGSNPPPPRTDSQQ
ncbi:hypothetical protein PT974_07311 [Cladobotryum mycophilum]|uniref:Uncharacterized protein n=1 Tax=Cladobotryum mycophilum TaxID=491253 RepID=A0ABR0SPA5_9HYPO